MAKAYVPEPTGFATKPTLARRMIERAVAEDVPFNWVAADSVYGAGDMETTLRCAGKGYVLSVNANCLFHSWAKPQPVGGTAKEIAGNLDEDAWQRLSAGDGTKGARPPTTGHISNLPISKRVNTTAHLRAFGRGAC